MRSFTIIATTVSLLFSGILKNAVIFASADHQVDASLVTSRLRSQTTGTVGEEQAGRNLQTDIPGAIWDIIQSNSSGLSTLENVVVVANAFEVFNDSVYTLALAPINKAFDNIEPQGYLTQLMSSMWILHLDDLLSYHASDIGTVMTSDFYDGQVIVMDNKETVNVSVTSDGAISFSGFYNSANLIKSGSDQFATNGIMHEIDAVLYPKFFGYNLLKLLNETQGCATFLDLILTAGLEDTILATGIFTIFAPTDVSFESLPTGTLDSWKDPANIETLVNVILYHVVAGVVPSVAFEEAALASPNNITTYTTFQGSKFKILVTTDNGAFINRNPIMQTDYLANNGIIHAIGAVLTPPPKKGSPTSSPVVVRTSLPTILTTSSASPSSTAFNAPVVDQPIAPATTPVTKPSGSAPVPKPITLPPTEAPLAVPPSLVVQPTSPVTPGTVSVVIAGQDDLTTFETAIKGANLESALSQSDTGVGSFTVFAPTDTAFANFDNTYLQTLLSPGWILHLQDFVLFHTTIARALYKADFLDRLKITMVNMENVTVSVPKTRSDIVTILFSKYGASNIIEYDLTATNGVVQKVDTVFKPNFFTTDLTHLAKRNNIFTIFVQLVKSVPGLTKVLSDGFYTVLAPTDDAFNALGQAKLDFLTDPANVENLRLVLLYHIIPGVYPTLSFRNGPLKTAQGASVQVKIVNANTITFDGATAVYVNALANNGIMHALDEVLTPPQGGTNSPVAKPVAKPVSLPIQPTQPPGNSIVGVVAGESDLSKFLSAITAARLGSALTGGVDLTLFAPVDSAFASFDQNLLNKLLQPDWVQHLRNLLLLHVTGKVSSSDLVAGRKLYMFNGEQITVDKNDKLSGSSFSGVALDTTDYQASNGVVHKLQGVLTPAFADKTVFTALSERSGFSIFSALLSSTDLSLPGSYTILAPTDGAFQSVSSSTLDSLQNNESQRKAFISSHIISGIYASPNLSQTTIKSLDGSQIKIGLDIQNGNLVVTFNSIEASVLDILGNNGIAHGIDSFLKEP